MNNQSEIRNPHSEMAAIRSRIRGRARALGFATIVVDECHCRTAGQADLGPILEGIAGLLGRAESSCRQEFVPSTPVRLTSRLWRDQFGDDSPMRGDRDPFAGFYAADVSTQVVLQLADAGGRHGRIIATCSLKRKPPSFHCCSMR